MFQCRMCSENPFVQMFAEGQHKDKPGKKKRKDQENRKPGKAASRRDDTAFNPRSEEEMAQFVQEWEQYVHPRARDFFANDAALHEVLMQLAKGIDRHSDPVLGPAKTCVYWFGDVTKGDLQAAIRMVKPGEEQESVTFVNRLLAFVFATDDSFEQLMKLPQDPFKMSCGDQLCVHLAHVAMPE